MAKSSFKTRISKYSTLIDAASQKHGVPKVLIEELIRQESGGNPNAKSHMGAGGLMQIMPATARGLGVKNVFDPAQAIEGGVKYLAQQFKTFGNWEQALAAYNSGPGNVRKAIKRGRQIPNISETKNYVQSISSKVKNRVNSGDIGAVGNQQPGLSPTPPPAPEPQSFTDFSNLSLEEMETQMTTPPTTGAMGEIIEPESTSFTDFSNLSLDEMEQQMTSPTTPTDIATGEIGLETPGAFALEAPEEPGFLDSLAAQQPQNVSDAATTLALKSVLGPVAGGMISSADAAPEQLTSFAAGLVPNLDDPLALALDTLPMIASGGLTKLAGSIPAIGDIVNQQNQRTSDLVNSGLAEGMNFFTDKPLTGADVQAVRNEWSQFVKQSVDNNLLHNFAGAGVQAYILPGPKVMQAIKLGRLSSAVLGNAFDATIMAALDKDTSVLEALTTGAVSGGFTGGAIGVGAGFNALYTGTKAVTSGVFSWLKQRSVFKDFNVSDKLAKIFRIGKTNIQLQNEANNATFKVVEKQQKELFRKANKVQKEMYEDSIKELEGKVANYSGLTEREVAENFISTVKELDQGLSNLYDDIIGSAKKQAGELVIDEKVLISKYEQWIRKKISTVVQDPNIPLDEAIKIYKSHVSQAQQKVIGRVQRFIHGLKNRPTQNTDAIYGSASKSPVTISELEAQRITARQNAAWNTFDTNDIEANMQYKELYHMIRDEILEQVGKKRPELKGAIQKFNAEYSKRKTGQVFFEKILNADPAKVLKNNALTSNNLMTLIKTNPEAVPAVRELILRDLANARNGKDLIKLLDTKYGTELLRQTIGDQAYKTMKAVGKRLNQLQSGKPIQLGFEPGTPLPPVVNAFDQQADEYVSHVADRVIANTLELNGDISPDFIIPRVLNILWPNLALDTLQENQQQQVPQQ